MSVQAWSYLVVGLTFALYIGIAVATRVRTTAGFYVAGRGVPPIANGMATAADWMSAASFISMAGLISFMGYTGAIYLMGWTGGYVLLALLLAPYLRKYGKFTIPEFVGDRYYSQVARVVAVLCAIFISFTYVAGQMRGVGIVFSRFLNVEIAVGLVIGMAIVFFYAVIGGMKGITYTQVAQYCVLIFAYMVPAIFISIMVAGNPIPQIGMGGAEHGSTTFLLDKLDGLHSELGFAPYTDGSKSMIDVLFITAALMVGTAGLPHVIIRFYTVRSARAARWSAMWALVFIGLLYTTAPAVAVFARVNMIQTLHGQNYAQAPEWFTKTIGKVNPPEKEDAVVQLNAAFMTDGAVIRVKEGTTVAKPIHLISILSADEPRSVAMRNLAMIGEKSKATLIESFVSLGDAAQFSNIVSEVSLGGGAELDHIKVQNEGPNTSHLSTWMTCIGADAQYRAFQFTTGAALSRNQHYVRFDGEHASANVSGTGMLRDNQHCDTTLIVDHAVPHCESREHFKLVLDDSARGIFQGKLVVRQGAQKTDGMQMAQALLLSENAEFDSKPELEIFADDVVCGHGSTSGQIDEDLLFYCRSRGIGEREARALLIAAFVGEALQLIEHDDIREALTETVSAWFGD